jgi:uncharacterized membrane protein YjjP (DUF1212 family)
MVKDETVITCTVTAALAAIGIAALVTGNDGGLITTIVAALAAFTGVGLGRASKSTE